MIDEKGNLSKSAQEQLDEIKKTMHALLEAVTGSPLSNPPKKGILETQMAINKDLYGDVDHPERKGLFKQVDENTADISSLKQNRRDVKILFTAIGCFFMWLATRAWEWVVAGHSK